MFFPRLANLRIDHDLTQAHVAAILHCQREVYRRYEKGLRELPFSFAIMLANYYNISLDYLVERVDICIPFDEIVKRENKSLRKLL